MRIESLRLKNFKMFRDIQLTNLPGFMVVVGANGTGKTTLFDVFGFLHDCLTRSVRQALTARGGFREVISRESDDPTILVALQYRMEIAGVNRLVTYHLKIAEELGSPVVVREILRYKRARYGAPYRFLDFRYGEGYAITNEEDFTKTDEELDREPQRLNSPDMLAIKSLGQFERFKAANAFRKLIEGWHVSDFHITAARGRKEALGESEHLSETGDNLPRVAQHLHEQHPEVFDRILCRVRDRVPGVEQIEPRVTEHGYLTLRFRDGSFHTPFLDGYVSDGTIKMFACLVLLHDPSPHPLQCVGEPENQPYPRLMSELAEEFRSYAQRGGQVLVDQDAAPDCRAVKRQFEQLCTEAGRPEAIVRLACRELEAFYLGDLEAVRQAFGLPSLAAHQQKRKFRDPDRLGSPSHELRRLTSGADQQVSGSRAIGPLLDLASTHSSSFRHLIRGILRLAGEPAAE